MSNLLEERIAELLREEEELQFVQFNNETAMLIGQKLLHEARSIGKSITIDITRNRHQIFHYAMDGTSPDNTEWIRRKNNVVNRYGHSTCYLGKTLEMYGINIEVYGGSSADYATGDGAFPLIIRGVGVVGTITVSGLGPGEDHALLIKVLREYLSK